MAYGHRAVTLTVLLILVTVTRPSGRVTGLLVEEWRVAGAGLGTPALDAQSAYFLAKGAELELISIERASGRIRWRASLDVEPNAPVGSRPAVIGDVVVAGGHDLVAFDRRSGARKWIFAPPASYGFGLYAGAWRGGVLFTGSASGEMWAFDVGSGRPRWRIRIAGRSSTVYAPVLAGDDVVSAYTDFGGSGARGLVSVNGHLGTLRWRAALPPLRPAEAPPAIAGGPIVIGDRIIVTGHDGTMHAFARSTGALLWSQPGGGVEEAQPDFRPLTSASGLVIAGSLSGSVAAFDPSSGRETWRRQPSDASVAFTLGASTRSVYVPYVSGLVVSLDPTDGREQWRKGGRALGFRWPPVVDGQFLFLAGAASGFVSLRESADRERG